MASRDTVLKNTSPQGTTRELTDDELLADALADFWADPLGHVMFSYPWATNRAIQLVELQSPYKERFPNCKYGPDVWACEMLDEIGEQVRKNGFDGLKTVDPLLYATVSGHGIGKSVIVAWLVKWIMDTRPGSRGTVTANTAEQLKSKTWAEVGKWHKMSMTEHWFSYSSGRGAMRLAKKGEEEDWFCSAQTCREENSEAFAGQHAASASSFYIFDEASRVPDPIFEVREGGTTDGEPMVFDFGNGTRNSGRFFEECSPKGRFRHRFITRSIDSRDVQITNKKRIDEWIEDYGIDSDFVKVRVLGQFPSAGSCQFIPTEMVEAAQLRELIVDPTAPLIIGVDVARYGDDESVIYPRIGNDCRSWAPTRKRGRYQGINTVALTNKVIEHIRMFEALGLVCSGLFIDETGIGGAVVDQLQALGYNPIGVNFGNKAIDDTYRYRSDEIWGNLKDKLDRFCLPANNQSCGVDLRTGLTQRDYGFTLQGNRIHLETKDDMKARGLISPDLVDALALTTAMEVVAKLPAHMQGRAITTINGGDYDPLDTKDI